MATAATTLTTPATTTPLTVGLLVVSTTAARDASSDSTTRLLRDLFASETTATWAVTKTRIVTDDRDAIQTSVRKWADADSVHLIVTTGGTGFAVSDITPEVRPSSLVPRALLRWETGHQAAAGQGSVWTSVRTTPLPPSPRKLICVVMQC